MFGFSIWVEGLFSVYRRENNFSVFIDGKNDYSVFIHGENVFSVLIDWDNGCSVLIDGKTVVWCL